MRAISARDIPEFRSEAEERRFWEKHNSAPHLDWEAAERLRLPNLQPTTQTISLRLPKHLLDAIKTAANARDVPYQSLIKVWLQERVDRTYLDTPPLLRRDTRQ